MVIEPRNSGNKIRVGTQEFKDLDRGVSVPSIPNTCPECLEAYDYKINAGDVSGFILDGGGFRGEMCFAGGTCIEYFFIHEPAE